MMNVWWRSGCAALLLCALTYNTTAHKQGVNCTSWPPACSQICAVDDGATHHCLCHAGFILSTDSSHCSLDESLEGPLLMYSQERHISVISLSESYSQPTEIPQQQLADVFIGPFIADVATRSVYYSSTRPGLSANNKDLNIIKLTDFIGQNDAEIITRGLIRITSVAIDWLARVLYVADRGLHKILACSLTTLHCTTVKTVGDPASIAVDPINRKLYWSDCSSTHSQLFSSWLDGTGSELITQLDSEGCIEELQVDQHLNASLYWINRGVAVHHINSLRLHNKQINVLPRKSTALAVYSDDVFWTYTSMNDQYQTMMTDIVAEDKFDLEVPLDDKTYQRLGPVLVQDGIVTLPTHISIVHQVQQPQGVNPCHSTKCSHVCLQAAGSGDVTCSCPLGSTLDQQDGSTCRANWTVPSVVVVNGRRLVRVVPDLVGSNELDVLYESQHDINSLAFDWSAHIIYFTTNTTSSSHSSTRESGSSISRIILNQNPLKEKAVFKQYSTILDIEVDWTSGNIYWINNETRDIRVGRQDGSAEESLMSHINKSGIVELPTALALHPADRKLYYSDCGSQPHIGVCELTGDDCVTRLVDVSGGCASNLFLEVTTGWLYWTDSKNHKIMKSDPVQSSTEMFRLTSGPISVVAGSDRVFWTGGYVSGVKYAAEHVNRDTTIHFGLDGFKKMIFFAESVQQPQEKNECTVNNGGCASGICIPSRTGHVCYTPGGEVHKEDKNSKLDSTTTSVQSVAWSSTESQRAHVTTSLKSSNTKVDEVKKEESLNKCQCLNGGQCDPRGDLCRCPQEYKGTRCELKRTAETATPAAAPPVSVVAEDVPPAAAAVPPAAAAAPAEPPAAAAGESDTIIYAAVALIAVTLLLVLIITAVCVHRRCRSGGRTDADDDENKTFGTPLYERPSGPKHILTLSIPRPKLADENDFC